MRRKFFLMQRTEKVTNFWLFYCLLRMQCLLLKLSFLPYLSSIKSQPSIAHTCQGFIFKTGVGGCSASYLFSKFIFFVLIKDVQTKISDRDAWWLRPTLFTLKYGVKKSARVLGNHVLESNFFQILNRLFKERIDSI